MLSTGAISSVVKLAAYRGKTSINYRKPQIQAGERRSTTLPLRRSFSRRFLCSGSSSDTGEMTNGPDITEEDYGLVDVRLDSKKYYEAFSDTRAFQSPHDLAWMLWQPPNTITRPDEWRLMQNERYSGPIKMHHVETAIAMGLRFQLEVQFRTGGTDAFMSVVDHINSGELEALENSLSPACYQYAKGWMQYMKEHGYTWEHHIESIESSKVLGFTGLLVYDDETGDANPVFNEDAHVSTFYRSRSRSKLGFEPPTSISMLLWSEIITSEKFSIQNSKGSTIMSSPLKRHRHIWKFGTTTTIPDAPNFDFDIAVHDIDNQVILRAADILTNEKLFLDRDAPRSEVWQMTRSM